MSKRWKKPKKVPQASNSHPTSPTAHPAPLVPVQPVPPIVPAAESSVPQNDKWTSGDWVGLFGGIIGILTGPTGCVVAWLSWSESKQSRIVSEEALAVSQRTYDRASGKVAAKLAFRGVLPEYKDVPKRLIPRTTLNSILRTVRFSTLADLRAFHPQLILENVGDEIIEAIRLETTAPLVATHFPENEKDREFAALLPWITKPPERDEITLTRNLRKGDIVHVPIARQLVAHMIHAQQHSQSGKDCFGRFDFRAFGRVVGVVSFDGDETIASQAIGCMWDPNGFPDDLCKKYLAETPARADIQMVK